MNLYVKGAKSTQRFLADGEGSIWRVQVKRQRGILELESDPGHPATFWIVSTYNNDVVGPIRWQ